MVFAVRDLMQDAYPELKETADRVSKAVLAEETTVCAHAGSWALKKLEERSSRNPSQVRRSTPAKNAFKLYDTFGMPLDFMQDAARDQGIAFDQAGFDRAMDEQQQLALALPGKARPSRRRILLTSSFRRQPSKAIARRAPTAAKCWPSSRAAKARRN